MGISFDFKPPAVSPIVRLEAAKAAAELAGAHALLAASQPLVPRDTGKLAESGHVESGADGAQVIYDAVAPDGYGYGVRQHEDLSLQHPNGGQAKFLEQPMNTEHESVLAAIHAAAAGVL